VDNGVAPYSYVRRDRLARAVEVRPLEPVQVPGMHVWNYLLWRRGDAAVDRV
jgi:hypothetical protein